MWGWMEQVSRLTVIELYHLTQPTSLDFLGGGPPGLFLQNVGLEALQDPAQGKAMAVEPSPCHSK